MLSTRTLPPGPAGCRYDASNVANVKLRVGWSLEPDHSGLWECLSLEHLRRRRQVQLDLSFGQNLLGYLSGIVVTIRGQEQDIACFEDRSKHRGDSSHAGTEDDDLRPLQFASADSRRVQVGLS